MPRRERHDYRHSISDAVDAALLGGALAVAAYLVTSWHFYTRPRLLALTALRDTPPDRDMLLRPSLYFVGSIVAMVLTGSLMASLPGIRAMPMLIWMRTELGGGLDGFLRAAAVYGLLPFVAAFHIVGWTKWHKKPLSFRQSLRVALYLVGGFLTLVAITSPATALILATDWSWANAVGLSIMAIAHFFYHPRAFRLWRAAGGFKKFDRAVTAYWWTFLSWLVLLPIVLDILEGLVTSSGG